MIQLRNVLNMRAVPGLAGPVNAAADMKHILLPPEPVLRRLAHLVAGQDHQVEQLQEAAMVPVRIRKEAASLAEVLATGVMDTVIAGVINLLLQEEVPQAGHLQAAVIQDQVHIQEAVVIPVEAVTAAI